MPGVRAYIGDLVRASDPTFSFEFSPPKDAAGETRLWQTIRELEPLGPSFVSITYGAGGSTRDTTVSSTERIATETTLLPMAHITAVNHSVAELRNLIGRLAEGRGGVDDMQQEVGDSNFLESGLERLHQHVRQTMNETDRVGEHDLSFTG